MAADDIPDIDIDIRSSFQRDLHLIRADKFLKALCSLTDKFSTVSCVWIVIHSLDLIRSYDRFCLADLSV